MLNLLRVIANPFLLLYRNESGERAGGQEGGRENFAKKGQVQPGGGLAL